MPGDGDPKVVIRVNPGEPVFVRAFIANDDRPVPGVRWQVKARTPAGAIILIPVMDDGLHADGAAADGIFVGAIIAEDGPDGFYALSAEGQPPQGARYLQASRVEVEAKGDLQHYRKRGRNSFVGWDYCRYIMLCRCGYQVGFLSEDEAWGRIMPMARAIQAAFPSWSELGEDYLVGREYWSIAETKKSGQYFRELEAWLVREPGSPWNQLAWRMVLGASAGSTMR